MYNFKWFKNISKNEKESKRVICELREFLSVVTNDNQFIRDISCCKLLLGIILYNSNPDKYTYEFLDLMNQIISLFL